MTIDDELIGRLLEEVHLTGKAHHSEPIWTKHVDSFIEKRLSISEMARILNAGGYEISRRGVNDWLLRNKHEETRYLRKNKNKSKSTPNQAKSHDTVVTMPKDNKFKILPAPDRKSEIHDLHLNSQPKKENYESKNAVAIQTKTSSDDTIDRMLKRIDESVAYRSKF